MGEPPARFVCTRQSVQEKVLPGQGVLLTQLVYPGRPVQKEDAAQTG